MIILFGAMVAAASAAEIVWSDTSTDSSNSSASDNITTENKSHTDDCIVVMNYNSL